MAKKDFKINWPLVGNTQITDYLTKCIARNSMAGTYIFCGPDNLGKTTTARYFAKALLCQNRQAGGILPCGECSSCLQVKVGAEEKGSADEEGEAGETHGDFHIIKQEKDKKNISIKAVREFIRALNMSSFLSAYYKIGVIKHADSLSSEAANALLKTLEEPKDGVIIILIARNIDSLPATIVSRSQILNFHPVDSDLIYEHLLEKYKASRSEAKNYSRLCLGRPALAVKFLQSREFRNNYMKQAGAFIGFWRHDINERFDAITEALGVKPSGQEAVRIARRLIEVWRGLTRDRLLLVYGLNNLIQHQAVEDELKKAGRETTVSRLLSLLGAMRQADEYLSANVNPKMVLENIAINVY